MEQSTGINYISGILQMKLINIGGHLYTIDSCLMQQNTNNAVKDSSGEICIVDTK